MTAVGNAGKGREAGSRNKRTVALMALAEDGETPGAFALRVMRDETKTDELRMHAARLAAPLVHPKPQPEPRYVTFVLPDEIKDVESLVATHATLLRSVASGDLSLEDARELSAILDNYRRGLELSDIEARLKALEGKRT
ncbi:MAG TPA: hypothetical protein VM144_09870 [Aestuariivirga sp.]|nr:hypothetical protein [Aestuariivirga sp.]